MTVNSIGRALVWLGVAYSVPLIPLSLLAGLFSYGLALLVLVPLWILGIRLMRAQYEASEATGTRLWWWSLAYHALPLIGWTIYAAQTRTSGDGHTVDAVWLALALFSPLVGTVLSVMALMIQARWAKERATAH